MSVIYCDRCDLQHDSDFVDCVVDPERPTEMICERSLTDDELLTLQVL